MKFHYDEDLLEAAVFICASRRRNGVPALQIARFNREREKLYGVLDPEERNDAFFRFHLGWFQEWGLDELLTRPVREFPLLTENLDLLAFRKSRGRNDEGAELYVNEARQRNAALSLRPERLGAPTDLSSFLHHEYMHLHDMVDPGFGYVPELAGVSRSPGQYRLAIERYRILWDISIDGRLHQRRLPTVSTLEQRWREFVSTFDFWPQDRQQEVFKELWSRSVTHSLLLQWVCALRQADSLAGPQPGGPCPLCGFSTFAWARPAALTGIIVEQVQKEFPHWTPAQGSCARCLQTFRVRHTPVSTAV